MKKSFILYTDTYESIKELSIKDKGALLDAIFLYVSEQKEIDLNPAAGMAFSFIKRSLDRESEKWETIRKERQIAGSKGGKMRVANQANATFAKQIQANQAVPVPVPVPVPVNKTKSTPLLKETAENPNRELGFTPEERKKLWDYANSLGGKNG